MPENINDECYEEYVGNIVRNFENYRCIFENGKELTEDEWNYGNKDFLAEGKNKDFGLEYASELLVAIGFGRHSLVCTASQ